MQRRSDETAAPRGRRHHPARVLAVVLTLVAMAFGTTACADTTLYTETFTVGPFNLAAMGQSGSTNSGIKFGIPRPAGDVAIRDMKFDLVDTNGNPVDHMMVHLHHIVMASTKRLDAACGTSGYAGYLGGERFAASGNEKTPVDFTGDYYYKVNAGDQWNALWDVMNESNMPMTVSIAYTITYAKGWASTRKDVTPYWFDVTGCGTSGFTVPGGGGAGSVYTKSATFTMPAAGTMLGGAGHLHDGGIDVSNTRANGDVLCTSTPTYMDTHIMTMSICPSINQPVSSGEKLNITARYDNSQKLTGVMGIMLMYLDIPPSG